MITYLSLNFSMAVQACLDLVRPDLELAAQLAQALAGRAPY